MYDSFPWFVWFTWMSRPLPYAWVDWFAWWPVRTDVGWRWLQRIQVRIHGEVAENGELCSWTEFRPAQHQRRLSDAGRLFVAFVLVAVAALALAGQVLVPSRFGVPGW